MDEIEALFPIPMLRSRQLLSPDLVAELTGNIRASAIEKNLRSDQLFHTQVASPDADPLYRFLAEAAAPKLIEFGKLLFGDTFRWTVKEMWTNILEPGGNQALHAHANSFVSGIFYLSESHPSCTTVFVRPPGGSDFSFRHHTRTASVGPFNAGKYVTPDARPGDLVLFPSYLLHEVPRNQGGQRITVSFNAIPDRLDCWGYTITFTP